MKSVVGAALAAAVIVTAGGAQAADYQKAVVSSVSSYATPNEFAGVTLNVACRRLPAMDFISSHMDIFEKATGVKIHFTNYPENEERSKIVADASNHIGGFQIYCLDNDYIPLFASNKWVSPLDSAIKPAYKLNDIFDSLRESYSWNGGLYGLPIYSEVTILYYRKDLFAAAGLEPPTTMQELEADAAKLNKPPRVFGIALRGLRGEGMNVYIWTEWMRSYGANFLDPTMHPVFNSPAAIEGTEQYTRLINKYGPPGDGTWGWDKVSSAFSAGRVAMIVESTAFYPVFDDPKESNVVGKVGYATVPSGPKGAFPANYSIGLAIPSSVNIHSKTFAAAAAFLQWATSEQMEFARTDKGIGNEDRKSVADSALLKSKIDASYISAVAEGQKIANPEYRPRIPEWREMGDIIGAQLESAFTHGKSVKAALDEAAKETAARFKAEAVLGKPRPYKEIFPDN